jgi:hypothetical protein
MLTARRGIVVALTLGAVLAPALPAQALADVCRSISNLTVGQWATYTGIGGHLAASETRVAVVGTERKGDSTFYWLEFNHSSTTNPAEDGIVQVLVPGFKLDPSAIRGLILKTGVQAAMRIPDQMVPLVVQGIAQSSSLFAIARRCDGAETVGWETVTVPAGAIHALHVKNTDGEAWLSPDVPFGVVKVVVAAGGQTVMASRGTGAKSSLPEAPPPQ